MDDTIDYRSRYERALIIAKDWYKHRNDGFTSVADMIARNPQGWATELHLRDALNVFLPRMFPELDNDEDWWNSFYEDFYERNKDNPEWSFR